MSTLPVDNNVAVWLSLATAILPVAVNVPTAGLYNSALAKVAVAFPPPAMRTIPLGNKVAVWCHLATVMLPVAENLPAAGSYSSALPLERSPPTMRTIPLGNKVAVCAPLPVVMLPVAENFPAVGSYSSTPHESRTHTIRSGISSCTMDHAGQLNWKPPSWLRGVGSGTGAAVCRR